MSDDTCDKCGGEIIVEDATLLSDTRIRELHICVDCGESHEVRGGRYTICKKHSLNNCVFCDVDGLYV